MDKAPDAFRTISEVAEDLDLPQHVLRFWETRFSQIKPMKRGGGRRYYRPDDVDLLRGIKHLLYGEGYTIRGVQRILKDHGVKFVQTVWKEGAPQPSKANGDFEESVEGELARPLPGSAARKSAQAEPGRRILGNLLPQFLGQDGAIEDETLTRSEPPLVDTPPQVEARPVTPQRPISRATPTRPISAVAVRDEEQARPVLPKDDLRKLQAALYELGECRRLIDHALGGEK